MAQGICAVPRNAPRVLQKLCADINLFELVEADPYHWQVGPNVLSWEDGRWEIDGLWEVDDNFVVDLLTNYGGAYTRIE